MGVTHHCRVPEVRRISTFATAPFFSSSEASQPESLITAPRNWLRLGLCPTTMMASCREYFSSSLRKSASPASGRKPGVDLQFAFIAQLIADQRRGLCAALQRTGNDRVDLRIQRSQGAADIAALLDSLFVEGAFLVFLRIGKVFACAGVA